jgi:hypothetical protein
VVKALRPEDEALVQATVTNTIGRLAVRSIFMCGLPASLRARFRHEAPFAIMRHMPGFRRVSNHVR